MAEIRNFITPLLAFVFLFQSLLCVEAQTVEYVISEEEAPFTVIGNVGEDSEVSINMTETEKSRLRFQMNKQSSNTYDELFSINENSGVLVNAVEINREDVCRTSDQCILGLSVNIFEDISNLLTVIQINVQVVDINDNTPTFPQSDVSIEVSELASVGDILVTQAAIDEDTDQFSVKTYQVLSGDGTFSVRPSQTEPIGESLEIVINKQLDRELKNFYQIIVIAIDGGTPPKTGSVTINITVTDANDNAPKFDKSPYNETIVENIPIGSTIIQIRAQDNDTGENARIKYKFKPGTPGKVMSVFSLNESSGDVSVIGPIDYEEDSTYQFIVEAEDHGSQSLSEKVYVYVYILDINDNAPQIYVNLPPGGADVSESADIGQNIATITVLDPDGGNNGTTVCNVNSEKFELVKLAFQNMYAINLKEKLDRETVPSHNVTIFCSDLGVPPKTNSTYFTLHVADINDNHPYFNPSELNVTFYENNNVGDIVTVITADDRDAGDNGRITYHLTDDDLGVFTIDSVSGVITANIEFDRENVSSYHFQIVAVDNGAERLSSSATVNIFISDRNDHTPIFSQSTYTFYTKENQVPGTIIGALTVGDLDIDENARYSFDIEDRFDDVFEVDEDGFIHARVSLDREASDHYELLVYITDYGQPPLSSSTKVKIYVEDVNDNPPVILYPTEGNHTVRLPVSAVAETFVARIVANDSDSGVNAALSYRIHEGDAGGIFEIRNKTGIITLSRQLTDRDVATYTLIVAVKDGGIPKRESWENLIVIIGNDSGMQNLIIVIAVCSVTLVLSLTLIIIILLIRRRDNAKQTGNAGRYGKEKKNFILNWLKCLSLSSKEIQSMGPDRSKDTNKHSNGKPEVDTRPIIPGSGESNASDDSTLKKEEPKPDLVQTDSGLSSMTINDPSPPDSGHGDSLFDSGYLEKVKSDLDLSASYPSQFTFVTGDGQRLSTSYSEQSIPESTNYYQRPQPPVPVYNRGFSYDEQHIRGPRKTPIYFARCRSSSESDSVAVKPSHYDLKSHGPDSSVPQSHSFKHVNNDSEPNGSYSGPYYVTSSLDRSDKSHYDRPKTQYSQVPSRTAFRRELPTISATPELYDPIQELTDISYQTNNDIISKVHPTREINHYRQNKGQTTHTSDSHSLHSHNSTDGSYQLNSTNYDPMFNTDIIV